MYNASGIRLGNRWEQRYHYEAELLADKLLGVDDGDYDETDGYDKYGDSIQNYCDTRCKTTSSLISKEISILWKTIVVASSGILIGFPIAAFVWRILTSNMFPPSILSIIKTTSVNYMLQAQSILHSMPYLIRHLNQIRIIRHPPSLFPLLLKILRKCIIIEAWRHIWIQIYKLSRSVRRRMTLNNAKLAYVRFFPAWIRRGIKSILQSSVQAQVHVAMGGILTASTFENLVWSSNIDDSVGGNEDAFIESSSSMIDLAATLDSTTSVDEAIKSAVDGIDVEGVDLFETGVLVESIVEDCLLDGLC